MLGGVGACCLFICDEGFYPRKRGVTMISFDQFRGVNLVSWFPCVVCFRIV